MLFKLLNIIIIKCLAGIIWVFIFHSSVLAQACIGGQIYTKDAYQYGRFEVAMRSAVGNGIVSSFFLYNLDLNCNWPAENNEIDIEMTGNSQDIYFTTHYPGPWYHSDSWSPGFNPHTGIHEYAFEWEPGIVRWFVDGTLVNVQDQEFVNELIHPMHIMMNLWAAEASDWVGPWNPSVMPVESEYDFVRFYDYTPNSGNAGTNNHFTLIWEEDFETFNDDRWIIEQNGGFGGNYCRFKASSVEFSGGKLFLQLEPDSGNAEFVPVTFSVDLNDENLMPSDVINLNGSFNNWCGNCAPMNESNGIWALTVNLEPGSHEYLYTLNLWEENGGAPLGSECDFTPCDEWTNYGLVVNSGSDPIVLETPCWGECPSCSVTSIHEIPDSEKKLLKIYDLSGREVKEISGQPLLYYFDDGTVERRYIIEK